MYRMCGGLCKVNSIFSPSAEHHAYASYDYGRIKYPFQLGGVDPEKDLEISLLLLDFFSCIEALISTHRVRLQDAVVYQGRSGQAASALLKSGL